jgi:pimeloyl-ACP methyl ester carboxylesterase
MPDQRGHGEKPLVRFSSLGGCETDDALAAIKYLRGLKADETTALVGASIGIFGVEMGALVGAATAAKDETVKSLVLDSVPGNSDDLLTSVIEKRFPFASSLTARVARLGAPVFYYNGCYRRDSSCDTARVVENRNVLLLAGGDNSELQASTSALPKCFPSSTKVESKTDMFPSGTNLVSASLQQFEDYDNRVIVFFKQTLGAPPVQ